MKILQFFFCKIYDRKYILIEKRTTHPSQILSIKMEVTLYKILCLFSRFSRKMFSGQLLLI